MHKTALELAREIGSPTEVIEILEALENDKNHPGRIAYMSGLSQGMVKAGNLFSYMSGLYHSGRVQILATSGSDGSGIANPTPGGAWPGFNWYKTELQHRGIPDSAIWAIQGPQRHSREETDALLETAKVGGWEDVVFVSVDYHRPRQILGCLKKMAEMNWKTRLYFPSIPFDWNAEMLGSQQVAQSTGMKEAETDWKVKVPKYMEKGDLASTQEFRDYMTWRNHRS